MGVKEAYPGELTSFARYLVAASGGTSVLQLNCDQSSPHLLVAETAAVAVKVTVGDTATVKVIATVAESMSRSLLRPQSGPKSKSVPLWQSHTVASGSHCGDWCT